MLKLTAVVKRVRFAHEGADTSFSGGGTNGSASGSTQGNSAELSQTVKGDGVEGGGKFGTSSSDTTGTSRTSSAGAQTATSPTLRFTCDVEFTVTGHISTEMTDGATGAAALTGPVGWVWGLSHAAGNKLGDAASRVLKQDTATVTGTAELDIQRLSCVPE